ncbi:MAG: histidine phosphatase family protein [Chloroflexota bacterium]
MCHLREVWFIRHGESEANAGLATGDPDTIRLTPAGHQQARRVSAYLPAQPDLIVTSPYVRTKETAQPTLNRYPASQHVEWPIQEFTYLSPQRCQNTTKFDRRPMVDAYWNRSDPHHVDGEGAESFVEMLSRVNGLWRRLQDDPSKKFMVIFTHGLFISAIQWSIYHHFAPPTAETMRLFNAFRHTLSVPNGSILKCRFDQQNQVWLHPFFTEHLID